MRPTKFVRLARVSEEPKPQELVKAVFVSKAARFAMTAPGVRYVAPVLVPAIVGKV